MLLSNEVYALSSKQLAMFKTVSEYLLHERDELVDSVCAHKSYGILTVVYPPGEEPKKPVMKSREQCLVEYTKSCRDKTENLRICETLDKVFRYDNAYSFYNDEINKHERKNCGGVTKLKGGDFLFIICDYAGADAPKNKDEVKRVGLAFPTPIKQEEKARETLRVRRTRINFSRLPALSLDTSAPKNDTLSTFQDGFNKSKLLKPIVSDTCGWNDRCIPEIEGFR